MTKITIRNKEIVQKANTGLYTLEMLGDVYGLTRERIRQIYTGITGKPYREHLKYAKRQHKIKITAQKKLVKYYCSVCGKGVTFGKAYHGTKLCAGCRKRMRTQQRCPTLVKCDNCGVMYYPRRASYFLRNNGRIKHQFHNRECYGELQSKIRTDPNTAIRNKEIIEKINSLSGTMRKYKIYALVGKEYGLATHTVYVINHERDKWK
jgi:hypothetical protein